MDFQFDFENDYRFNDQDCNCDHMDDRWFYDDFKYDESIITSNIPESPSAHYHHLDNANETLQDTNSNDSSITLLSQNNFYDSESQPRETKTANQETNLHWPGEQTNIIFSQSSGLFKNPKAKSISEIVEKWPEMLDQLFNSVIDLNRPIYNSFTIYEILREITGCFLSQRELTYLRKNIFNVIIPKFKRDEQRNKNKNIECLEKNRRTLLPILKQTEIQCKIRHYILQRRSSYQLNEVVTFFLQRNTL